MERSRKGVDGEGPETVLRKTEGKRPEKGTR